MDAFARTLLHEMCHSTAREVGRDVERTDEGYAREELVAELGSAFAAADAGLDMSAFANADMGKTFLENHAAYIRGWLTAIRDDPSALARAAAQASKAADFIQARREKLISSRGAHALESALDLQPLSDRARFAREAASEAAKGMETTRGAWRSMCDARSYGRGNGMVRRRDRLPKTLANTRHPSRITMYLIKGTLCATGTRQDVRTQ
jgi:hypothetical protein